MNRLCRSGIGVALLVLVALPGGANDPFRQTTKSASEKPLTTFERFLPLAVAGDSSIQHLLGFMFFYGEGVEANYEEALQWFRLAAEEGDARAQRNLGLIHARAIPRVPEKFFDPVEANMWFSQLAANTEYERHSSYAAKVYPRYIGHDIASVLDKSSRPKLGRNIYLGSCAGCHGFDGYGAYAGVPSFADGDRLEQPDDALVASILRGRGSMPSWRGRLPEDAAREVVQYIRENFADRPPDANKSMLKETVADADDVLVLGEKIYLSFCGGCHGFNGIAWYVNSPSFALRERLDKTDEELAYSIKNGIGAMPSWEYMLKPEYIYALLKFVRTLPDTYESGLITELRHPDQFMRFRPRGETGSTWTADDVR